MAKRIDADRLIRLVDKGAALIDVLPANVFSQEHLPGAVNIPLATMRPEDLDDLDRARPTVVYCFDQH
jgi:rhodanese-related sulfurtransferase